MRGIVVGRPITAAVVCLLVLAGDVTPAAANQNHAAPTGVHLELDADRGHGEDPSPVEHASCDGRLTPAVHVRYPAAAAAVGTGPASKRLAGDADVRLDLHEIQPHAFRLEPSGSGAVLHTPRGDLVLALDPSGPCPAIDLREEGGCLTGDLRWRILRGTRSMRAARGAGTMSVSCAQTGPGAARTLDAEFTGQVEVLQPRFEAVAQRAWFATLDDYLAGTATVRFAVGLTDQATSGDAFDVNVSHGTNVWTVGDLTQDRSHVVLEGKFPVACTPTEVGCVRWSVPRPEPPTPPDIPQPPKVEFPQVPDVSIDPQRLRDEVARCVDRPGPGCMREELPEPPPLPCPRFSCLPELPELPQVSIDPDELNEQVRRCLRAPGPGCRPAVETPRPAPPPCPGLSCAPDVPEVPEEPQAPDPCPDLGCIGPTTPPSIVPLLGNAPCGIGRLSCVVSVGLTVFSDDALGSSTSRIVPLYAPVEPVPEP